MELWEIKANALRLMFADSDMQFNKQEFENEEVYNNGNTREKLIRMNDSIRRAIDLYYMYCGSFGKKAKTKYKIIEDKLTNILDLDNIKDFGLPSRIGLIENRREGIPPLSNLEYYFDNIDKTIEVEFNGIPENTLRKMEFNLYYTTKKFNLPSDNSINDLTFDLDTLYIPSEVQNMIPYYVKGELYEEDESGLAQLSKKEYIQFLISFNNKFSNVQTKVKSNFVRG